MNFIITGGSGFIGLHLTNLLHEQFPESNIYNLDIVEPKDNRTSVYVKCDVRDKIEVPFEPKEEDILFHFAAIHKTPGYPDFDYFNTNLRGADNVTEFADKYNIKRIVFTSSIAPYAASEEEKTEDTLPTPNTPYGISKLVSEKVFMKWQNKSTDRKLVIVRPGVVFGKEENGNFTRLYFGIKGHKFMYPGRKDTIKACIYVKDLVRIMLFLLDKQDESVSLYNCTYHPAYTIEQIAEEMKKQTGMDNMIIKLPSWLIMTAAAIIGPIGGERLLGICPARVKKLMVSTNISGKKLANSGFQFKYTFGEALKDWYADNNNQCLK